MRRLKKVSQNKKGVKVLRMKVSLKNGWKTNFIEETKEKGGVESKETLEKCH